MIKFVMCLRQHADMTREQFKDYCLNKHGPFFMQNAEAMGALRYVQSHTVNTPLNEGLRQSRGMQPEYDGVAEVWFASEQALMAGMSSPEVRNSTPRCWRTKATSSTMNAHRPSSWENMSSDRPVDGIASALSRLNHSSAGGRRQTHPVTR
jgi:uncharacterized protein (TIGR02118 family)